MPVAKFEMPDGRIARFEVPEGTTPEQAQAQISAFLSAQSGQSEMSAPAPAPAPAEPDDGILSGARDVLMEFAGSANRSVTELVDFLGPGAVNAVLRLSGSEYQVPTVTDSLGKFGIGNTGYMDEGVARDAVQAAGSTLTAAGGLASVPRAAASKGAVLADMLGLGSSTGTGAAVGGERVYKTLEELQPKQVKVSKKELEKTAIKHSLLSKRGDKVAAGFKMSPSGKVVKDKAQRTAVKQGFDEGLVAMVSAANPDTRLKLKKMVDIVRQGRKNFRNQGESRPSDVVGESITERIKVVYSANKVAGKRLDAVAEGLKDRHVDVSPAIDNLLGKLGKMGVKYDPKTGDADFMGSDIEALEGTEAFLSRVLKRLRNTRAPSAYDVHRMKKYIDEQVSYGKKSEGLGGKAENIVKSLRHDLDEILDKNFPEYDAVNTQYSDTIKVLRDIQELSGKRIDVTGKNANKAIGTLSRRLLGNAVSRVPLNNTLEELDATARRYLDKNGGNEIVPYGTITRTTGVEDLGDDDIISQVLFVDELDRMFDTHSRTSLQGDAEKAIRSMGRSRGELAIDMAAKGAAKLRGVSDDNALEAMSKLLEKGGE